MPSAYLPFAIQRIHNVFRHHRDQTTTSYILNYALIKLRYLHQRFKFLISSFHTYTSRVIRHISLHRLTFRKPYDTYPSPSAEQRYWDSAERGLRQLRQSDARFVGSERSKNVRVPEMPPLIMYYVPALLPRYRDEDGRTKRGKRRIKEDGCRLEPEDYYGQWHRMAFL